MRAGTSGLDFISIKESIKCVYPSTKSWTISINTNDLPGIAVTNYDRINGKAYLSS
jgi:hypothetical protein